MGTSIAHADESEAGSTVHAPVGVQWLRHFYGSSIPFAFYLQIAIKSRADERTRTADLISLRVCLRAF